MLHQLFKIPHLPSHYIKQFKLVLVASFLAGFYLVMYDISVHAIFIYTAGMEQLYLGMLFAGTVMVLIALYYSNSRREYPVVSSFYVYYGAIILAGIPLAVSIFFPYIALVYISLSAWLFIHYFTLVLFKKIIELYFDNDYRRSAYFYASLFLTAGASLAGFVTLSVLYLNISIKQISLSLPFIIAGIIICIEKLNKRNMYIALKTFRRNNKGKPKLLLSINALVITTTFIGFLIHIQFIDYARLTYQKIWGISKVLSLYLAMFYLFTYLLKRFLKPRLLNTFDSPFSVVLTPLINTGLAIAIAVLLYFIPHQLGNIPSIFILLSFIILKLFFDSAKYAIDWPAYEVAMVSVIYKPILHYLLFRGALIIGATVVFAALLYKLSTFFVYQSMFIVVIIVSAGLCWFYFAIQTARRYQRKLISKISHNDEETGTPRIKNIIHNITRDFHKFNTDFFNFFKQIFPERFKDLLEKLLDDKNLASRKYALNNILHINYRKAAKLLEPENVIHNPLISNVQSLITSIHNDLKLSENYDKIKQLCYSDKAADRAKAASLLSYVKGLDASGEIIWLMRDVEHSVKAEAIKSARYFDSGELNYLLVDYLNSAEYYSYAFEALAYKRNNTIDYIEQLLKNEQFPDELIIRIIRLYEKIASFKSVEKIVSFLDHPTKRIRFRAVQSLQNLGYKATQVVNNKIFNLIVKQAELTTWYIAIINQLNQIPGFYWLRVSIQREYQNAINDLFKLLNLLYHEEALNEAYHFIKVNSEASINYACELVDSVLQEDLKKVVLPIISASENFEKLQQLQIYYAFEEENKQVLKSVFNHSVNLISPVTQAIAIYSLIELDSIANYEDDLIACLYSPVEIIKETAAYVIVSKYHYLLKKVNNRLDTITRELVFKLSQPAFNPEKLLLFIYDKYFNHKHFSGLDNNILLNLTHHSHIEYIPGKTDYHLVNSKMPAVGFVMITSGSLNLYHNGEHKGKFTENDLIFTQLSEQKENDLLILRTKEPVKILYIDKLNFEKLNFDYENLFIHMFNYYLSTANTKS